MADLASFSLSDRRAAPHSRAHQYLLTAVSAVIQSAARLERGRTQIDTTIHMVMAKKLFKLSFTITSDQCLITIRSWCWSMIHMLDHQNNVSIAFSMSGNLGLDTLLLIIPAMDSGFSHLGEKGLPSTI